MRKKKEEAWLPQVGHVMETKWLPRDISIGWHENLPKGTLLFGWGAGDTLQLWETVSRTESKFIGFVVKEL